MSGGKARERAEQWSLSYVAARLADGDDPLELSRDHWKDNVVFLETCSGESLRGLTGSSSCALCHVYWSQDCQGCPLYEAGLGCVDPDSPPSPYEQVEDADTPERWLEATRALLKVLEGLVEEHEQWLKEREEVSKE